MKKNRITCQAEKWPHVHHSICELSNTQCCFTSHIGPMFTCLTGCTVINSLQFSCFEFVWGTTNMVAHASSVCVCLWSVLLFSIVVDRCCVECVKRHEFISYGEVIQEWSIIKYRWLSGEVDVHWPGRGAVWRVVGTAQRVSLLLSKVSPVQIRHHSVVK